MPITKATSGVIANNAVGTAQLSARSVTLAKLDSSLQNIVNSVGFRPVVAYGGQTSVAFFEGIPWQYHVFGTSTAGVDTFYVANSGSDGKIQYLVVGGGGGGGVLTNMNSGASSRIPIVPGTYTVTIGLGGTGGTSTISSSAGASSSLIGPGVSITATGGGGGGSGRITSGVASTLAAGTGSSGGGGGKARFRTTSESVGAKGLGTPGEGFDGADATAGANQPGGGGGGAGAAAVGGEVGSGLVVSDRGTFGIGGSSPNTGTTNGTSQSLYGYGGSGAAQFLAGIRSAISYTGGSGGIGMVIIRYPLASI